MARALLSADKTVRAVVRKLRMLQNPVALLRSAFHGELRVGCRPSARQRASFLQRLDKPVPMIANRILAVWRRSLLGGG
jgi:hypothetical protein